MSGEHVESIAAVFAGFSSVAAPVQLWLWRRRAEHAEFHRQVLGGMAWQFPGYYADPSPLPHFHLFRRSPHAR